MDMCLMAYRRSFTALKLLKLLTSGMKLGNEKIITWSKNGHGFSRIPHQSK